jgi:tripartite-type tricarboxylate transporter receptor subunit TctC
MTRIAACAAFVAALMAPSFAAAQSAGSYPDRPIKFVVPVSAGGTTDIMARVLAARLSAAWGQPVIVENKPGGSGIAAAESVARARPDGYTLFMGTIGTLSVNQSLFPKLSYDSMRDFAPVTLVAVAPIVLVINPKVPARNVAELVALAKSKPGSLNYSTSGNGASPHLAAELFKSLAGIDVVHVPYNGGGPSIAAVISGDVHMMFDNVFTALPHVKDGRLRALAVASRERSKSMPDVPTMAEAGLPGHEIAGWVGLVAPAATPGEIVRKLSSELARQMAFPEVREKFVGADPVGNTPEEFAAFLRAEIAKWGKLIRESNIRPE